MAKALQQKKVTKVSPIPAIKFWQTKYFNEWLVFLVSILLFAYTIGSGYNMDDELVTINHRLTSKGISAIPEIFTSHYYQDESGYAYEYRPLVLASFAIEHQFFGDNAHVSHFFNVLLYALCCLLLLKVLLGLFKNYSPLLALAITLLFIVHPAHTEVVCNIKNRDEILGLIFALLTLLVAIKGIDTSRWWWYALVPVLYALALMGKITVICFIIIIPLALILFTEASWFLVLLITFLLMVPSFFLLNWDYGSQKILLFAGALGIVMLLYAINNFKAFQQAVKNGIKRFVIAFFPNRLATDDASSTTENQPYAATLLEGIKPDRKFFSPVAIILTTVLAASYLLCIGRLHSLIGIIPIGLLILLAWKGEERISWWSVIMIEICIVANVLVSNTITDNYVMAMYIIPVGIYLVLQLYYGKRTLFIPTLISLIIFITIWKYEKNGLDIFFFLIIILLNNKYVRYVGLIMLLVAEVNLFPFKTPSAGLDFISNGLEMAVILCIHFNTRLRVIPWILLLLVLSWFHFNRYNLDRQIHVQKAISTIVTTGNKINPQVISAPENRPLSYIEDCVDLTTPIATRMGTSSEILFHYLCKVVVPYPLSFYYGSKFIYPQKITDAVPLTSLVLYLLLFITALLLLKRERLISFGLFTYLISVAVFSNYLQPVPGMVADRFLLIPSLGWIIVLVVIMQKIWRVDMGPKVTLWTAVPKYAQYVFLGILVIYGCMSFSRSLDWHDDLTLMRHDIKVVPESIQAHNLLGIHLVKASFLTADLGQQYRMRQEALEQLKTSYALYPAYFNFSYDIGRIFTLLNMPDSALVYFKLAYAIKTDFPDLSASIANIYFAKNDFQACIPYFVHLIDLKTDDFTAYDKLSFAYFKTNQFELSVQTNTEAIKRLPTRVDPYINIATCYMNTNKRDSAVAWLNRALVVSPDNPTVLNYLKNLNK